MSDSHDINDRYDIDPVALAYRYTPRYEDSLEITHYHLQCGTQLCRSNRSGVLCCAVRIWRVRTELYHEHHLVPVHLIQWQFSYIPRPHAISD